MKVLLHLCCGPCASYPLPFLLNEGHEVAAIFYNPNIHPYIEYEKRRAAARTLVNNHGIDLIVDAEYDPTIYLQNIAFQEQHRCRICHQLRLEKTAELASNEGFDAFTTSLLVSPYQKHDLIKQSGEEYSLQYGVGFLYYDWRPYYRETITRSKEMGLYRQPYCGCIYSEWERYGKNRWEERA